MPPSSPSRVLTAPTPWLVGWALLCTGLSATSYADAAAIPMVVSAWIVGVTLAPAAVRRWRGDPRWPMGTRMRHLLAALAGTLGGIAALGLLSLAVVGTGQPEDLTGYGLLFFGGLYAGLPALALVLLTLVWKLVELARSR